MPATAGVKPLQPQPTHPTPVGYPGGNSLGVSAGPEPAEATAARGVGQAGSEQRFDGLTRVDVASAYVGIMVVLAIILALIFFAGFLLAPHGFGVGMPLSVRGDESYPMIECGTAVGAEKMKPGESPALTSRIFSCMNTPVSRRICEACQRAGSVALRANETAP